MKKDCCNYFKTLLDKIDVICKKNAKVQHITGIKVSIYMNAKIAIVTPHCEVELLCKVQISQFLVWYKVMFLMGCAKKVFRLKKSKIIGAEALRTRLRDSSQVEKRFRNEKNRNFWRNIR